jgi:hypothetical protein
MTKITATPTGLYERELELNTTFLSALTNYSFGIPLPTNCEDIDSALSKYFLDNDIKKSDYVIFDVYGYSHGGMSLSLTPYECRFDSGKAGYLILSKHWLRNTYDVKKITKKIIENSKYFFQGDIETLNSFLSGNVYSIHLIENDKVIDNTLYIGYPDGFNSSFFGDKYSEVEVEVDDF